MGMHPTAEAYRVAMANGDHTSAANLLMQAHSGAYNSDLIDQIHSVGRMTRAELTAPPADVLDSVDPNETVRVTTRIFGRR